jgi:oligopeptide transport system substrate-binding protein
MKHRSLAPVLLISTVLGGLALAVLAGRHHPSVSPDPGVRSFRMTLSNEPPTLDWSLATDSVSFMVITNLMEGLAEYDADLHPRPAAAERWEVSDDGKTYTFYLRAGLRWTDGRPVTAGDFVYSWRRLLDPKTGAQYAYFLYDVVNAREYNSGTITDPASVGVRAIDDRTLEVRLEKPLVYFPSLTTFMVTFPQREDLIEKYGDAWTDPGHLVTNGPFRLAEWRHEYKLVLEANPAYRTGKPPLDRVELFVINEPTTALTLYETGDLDMVNLPPEAMAAYREAPDRRSHPLLRGNYYGFNVHRPPFDDVRVRRAFSMAVDRGEIVRILNGGELPTGSWIPPGMDGYNPEIGLNFDPGEARRLLAEAGYPGGKGFEPVTAVFNTGSVNRLVAENLQSQWKRTLNVPVALDNMEWKVYLRRLDTDPPDLFRLSWGADYPDPDNFMAVFLTDGGNNRTKWGNPRYDGLLARGTSESDPERRKAIYDEAQRILVEEETSIIPLFVSVQNTLVKPYVKDLTLNSMELLYLKSVSLDPAP